MACDILARECGTSCTKLSQIPDLKVFYARFIKETTLVDDDDGHHDHDAEELNGSVSH